MHKKKVSLRLRSGQANTFFVLCLAFAILTGCANREPETKGIKIGDLAPTGRRVESQLLRTTNIDVITFELPADNIKSLDEIWQILPANSDSLRYTYPNDFAANGLRVATGDFGQYNKITGILSSIKARKLLTTSLLIQNGQVETLVLGRLTRKTAISYIDRTGRIETAQAGPAILGLQIYARQITDPSAGGGLARVQITPAILSSTEGLAPELAERLKANDLRIYSAGFGLNMKPGDIVLLAPSQLSTDETAAAGRFFTRAGSYPTIKVLLFVCTSIT